MWEHGYRQGRCWASMMKFIIIIIITMSSLTSSLMISLEPAFLCYDPGKGSAIQNAAPRCVREKWILAKLRFSRRRSSNIPICS